LNRPQAPPAQALRQVGEAEARIARQEAVVKGFELAGDAWAAELARETLALMRAAFALALLLEAVELAGCGDWPDRRAQPQA
jgi:hypothetical protein